MIRVATLALFVSEMFLKTLRAVRQKSVVGPVCRSGMRHAEADVVVPASLRKWRDTGRAFCSGNSNLGLENTLDSGVIRRTKALELDEVQRKQGLAEILRSKGKESEIYALQTEMRELMGNHRTTQALEIAEKLRALVKEVYGSNHPVYASTMNNIGMTYRMEAKWDEAIECYTEAVRIYRSQLGERHVNTIVAMENHGHACKALSSTKKGMEKLQYLEAARDLFQEALEAKRSSLGDENVQIGLTLQNLGGVLRELSKPAKASKMIREGLEIIKRLYPRNHAMVGTAFNNLAYDQKRNGLYLEAEKNYEEALDIRQSVFGENHPETVLVMNNLAELYISMNKPEKAQEIQEKILELLGYEDHDEESSEWNRGKP